MGKTGLHILIMITFPVAGITPFAFLVILAGEAFGTGPYYYHWLALIPLSLLACAWIVAALRIHRKGLRA